MKRTVLSKFFAFLVISLFIISYFSQVNKITLAAQQEGNWVAEPLHVSQLANPLAFLGYTPSQIRTAYGLPSSGGAGTTIAIIDAYDTPSIWSDLTTFSHQFGLPAPASSNFEVVKMDPKISTNSSWMTETCLDVEWAYAIAPDSKILLVEAKSSSSDDLTPAVDYARNRPDVVSISISWGTSEYIGENQVDSLFTSNYGAVFFASSGDSGAGALWPSCSRNVVAVGGTTLNLNSDGTVSSETAWSGSGGGISKYEARPAYQTNFGLTTAGRAVPDVSYNADVNTGFRVYCNSQWIVVGGTSAGAPQWAAIQALGRSATNANLYRDAKLDYSSYFRDITSGSNGGYSAIPGYDCVTGLGSPLTINFGSLTVSPTSGPAGGLITLNGIGFTSNSSVNIFYLNPINSAWNLIVNNVATESLQNFNYTFDAPDLLQNNPVGDNQPLFNNIIFRAQDNSNGKSYNTTIPYMEWRRGIIEVGDSSAMGIYGNNTDLSTTTFVQNNQTIAIVGKWFCPGVISLLWDGTDLGTAVIDENGMFNATIGVPATSAGQHTLTIKDGASNFCVNVTRLPTINNDYDDLWHTSDFIINLTPDYNVTETFYSINGGQFLNVTANGQPNITSEGSNNMLEYWSTWDVYGTGLVELPHVTLTGIQLEKTPPAVSMQINNGVTSTSSSIVTLTINANDSLSSLSQIRFSNDGIWDQSSWEQYATTRSWQLISGDGAKTIYCQIKDDAGLIASFSSSIILITSQPSPSASPSENSISSATKSPSTNPSGTPSPTVTPYPSNSKSPLSSATPVVPELSIQIFLVLLALTTLLFGVAYKRKHI